MPIQDWGAELCAPVCSHFGMLAAARWILQETVEPLKAALAESPGFRLRIVGHSLGAGAAALLTMMCAGPSRLVQLAHPVLSRRCEGGEARISGVAGLFAARRLHVCWGVDSVPEVCRLQPGCAMRRRSLRKPRAWQLRAPRA